MIENPVRFCCCRPCTLTGKASSLPSKSIGRMLPKLRKGCLARPLSPHQRSKHTHNLTLPFTGKAISLPGKSIGSVLAKLQGQLPAETLEAVGQFHAQVREQTCFNLICINLICLNLI